MITSTHTVGRDKTWSSGLADSGGNSLSSCDNVGNPEEGGNSTTIALAQTFMGKILTPARNAGGGAGLQHSAKKKPSDSSQTLSMGKNHPSR